MPATEHSRQGLLSLRVCYLKPPGMVAVERAHTCMLCYKLHTASSVGLQVTC
jgi:hypothetical protein